MKPAAGARLAGRYEVRALIADRPTGELYRGYDEQIGVEVALRFVDDDLLVDDGERQRFVQRARRGKSLQHPNILRLYDVVLDGDYVFLALQWAPGERLSRRLQRGPVPIDEARNIIRRVAAGTAHAHQHGVVLGNIAADTVLLYPDDVKLSNVGIGPALPRDRFLAAMAARHAASDLAPEVLAGGALDERADVFAVAQLARTLLVEPSEAVRAVLDRGLDDAVSRPRDVEAFVRELEAALDGRELERGLPIVPTGSDTERWERLPPLPTEGGETRPDVQAPSENTNTLDIGDLIEVRTETSDVTELGHRRSASHVLPRPTASIPLVSSASQPEVAALAALPTRRLETELEETTPPRGRRFDHEEDASTRRHERLPAPMPDYEIVRGMVAERLPTQANPPQPPTVPHPHSMWLPLMLSLALVLGIVGTMYAMRVSRPNPVAVTQPPPASFASPTPIASPIPVARPTPVASPTPPPIAVAPVPSVAPIHSSPSPPTVAASPDACPLGMAPLSAPHAFCIDRYEYPGGHTTPRTRVSLDDAKKICASRDARLCTDAEWEQACRGPAQASYPYGSSFDATRCNVGGTLVEAGAMARCRSAAGAFDMSGNAAEWTASGTQRGGSAMQPASNARCSHVVRGTDPEGAADVGFRCCLDR